MEQLSANKYLDKAERRMLLQRSDWKGLGEVCHTWLWIAAAFTLAGLYSNVFTIVIAFFILGGKQLACAIIMHDTSHYALFKKKSTNDFIGKWFGAYPVFNNLTQYRPYHYQHHVTTGTAEDPDISLTWGYPTSPKSMFRKFLRDLLGFTGIKGQLGLLAIHLGFYQYTMSREVRPTKNKHRSWSAFFKTGFNNLHGPILANLMLFAVLWLFGAPWLYLLWIGALLTTFNFSARVRSIAEHSVVDNPEDPLRNTRTTYANWLERMLFAPHHVNYHLEHHMLMSVPPYNLPKMHAILKQKGFYEEAGLLEKNYWNIIKLAIQKK